MDNTQKNTSTTPPVPQADLRHYTVMDEDHPDVIVVMECGCNRIRIILVDPEIVPGVDPVVIDDGDNVAVLHNRDFVDASLDMIEEALQGTEAEGHHIVRLVGALASRSVLAYHRARKAEGSDPS